MHWKMDLYFFCCSVPLSSWRLTDWALILQRCFELFMFLLHRFSNRLASFWKYRSTYSFEPHLWFLWRVNDCLCSWNLLFLSWRWSSRGKGKFWDSFYAFFWILTIAYPLIWETYYSIFSFYCLHTKSLSPLALKTHINSYTF